MKFLIKVECYECGETISIPYDLLRDHAEYGYCKDCREGVEIRFYAGVLDITRLMQE